MPPSTEILPHLSSRSNNCGCDVCGKTIISTPECFCENSHPTSMGGSALLLGHMSVNTLTVSELFPNCTQTLVVAISPQALDFGTIDSSFCSHKCRYDNTALYK